MSASHNDGPDDLESGRDAAEPSETRMRQALERLSGDKPTERPAPDRAVFDRVTSDRSHTDRSPSDRTTSDRSLSDRASFERPTFDRIERPMSRSGNSASGGFGSAASRRHRYVQDGEVPVVQISSLRDRRRDAPAAVAAAAEPAADANRAALQQERLARQQAQHSLEKAQVTIHGLETRLGHAEMTKSEALEQVHAHEATIARLQADLAELAGQLKAAQHEATEARRRTGEIESALADLRLLAEPAPDVVPEPPPLLRPRAPKPAGRRSEATRAARAALPPVAAEEPEPVQWWLTPPPKSKPRRRGA